MQGGHPFARLAAGDALVGHGGIEKTVAQDDLAGCQGRPDHLPDVLHAVGDIEQQLGGRVDIDRLRVEQDGADTLAQRRAARFAGQPTIAAPGAQKTGRGFHLGALAGTLDPFQSDEHTLFVVDQSP